MSNLLSVSSQLDQFLRELMELIPKFYSDGFGKNSVGLVPGRSESEDIQIGLDEFCENLLIEKLRKTGCGIHLFSEHTRLVVGDSETLDYFITCDPFDGSGHYMRGLPAEWWTVLTVWDSKSGTPVWACAADFIRKEIYFADSNGVTLELYSTGKVFNINPSKDTRVSDESIIACYTMSPKYFRLWSKNLSNFTKIMENQFPKMRFWPDGGACTYPWLSRGLTNAYVMFDEPRTEIDPGLGFVWASGLKVFSVSDEGDLNEYIFEPDKSLDRIPWFIASCTKDLAKDIVNLVLG
jgi:fructose-1,6-bisphosphatase/inositol monophosphatase family enzyme